MKSGHPREVAGVGIRIAGGVLIALVAACAGRERPPETDPPWMLPPPAVKSPPAPEPAPVEASPQPSEPVAVAPPSPPPAAKPEPAAIKPEAPVAKPEAAPEKPVAKVPAAPAPKKEPAPAAKPPTLDLASLEKRLKDTSAIGVFTKLTLKNQVDDLVNQFRAYYQGQTKTTLAALRQPYDQLVLKVLALLQDGDPPLARAVAESREAIWGILTDPEKFKKL
jgi:hypothetical protein